jgi:hypothetical protein
MEKLYPCHGVNAADAWKAWAAMTAREFYDGDLENHSEDFSGVVFEKALHYPISLTHLISRAALSYRRSSQHIRNNKVGFRVIWFVQAEYV